VEVAHRRGDAICGGRIAPKVNGVAKPVAGRVAVGCKVEMGVYEEQFQLINERLKAGVYQGLNVRGSHL